MFQPLYHSCDTVPALQTARFERACRKPPHPFCASGHSRGDSLPLGERSSR